MASAREDPVGASARGRALQTAGTLRRLRHLREVTTVLCEAKLRLGPAEGRQASSKSPESQRWRLVFPSGGQQPAQQHSPWAGLCGWFVLTS